MTDPHAIIARAICSSSDVDISDGNPSMCPCQHYLEDCSAMIECGAAVQAVTAALAEAGWAIVPVEASEEMIEAGDEYSGYDMIDAQPEKWWKAMIAAALIPPAT